MWTDNDDGPKPALFFLPDERAEASLVARMIKENGDYDHTAVLFRTNAQSGLFEQEFVKPGLAIPYKVVGALKFYDREQVKDGLSLMYLLCNRKDVVSFRRMVNKPSRGSGKPRWPPSRRLQRRTETIISRLCGTPLSGRRRTGRFLSMIFLQSATRCLRKKNLPTRCRNSFRKAG